jgi:hypothetical protein
VIQVAGAELARLIAPPFTQALLVAVEAKVADRRMVDALSAAIKDGRQPTGVN